MAAAVFYATAYYQCKAFSVAKGYLLEQLATDDFLLIFPAMYIALFIGVDLNIFV